MMECSRHWFPDPVTGAPVEALWLCSDSVELIVLPQRALDIYKLRYRNAGISYTDLHAKIIPEGFCEAGTEDFSTHFFAGMMTTCGLIQAVRPFQEN